MDRLMAIGPKSREFDDHIIAIVFFLMNEESYELSIPR